MKKEGITIKCENCDKQYVVVKSTSRLKQELIFDFAICPYCGKARGPEKWIGYDILKRCKRCGLPFKLSPHVGKGLCGMCFIAEYRQKYFKDRYQKKSLQN